ncbi:TIGR02444 family protein [Pseudomonas sp. NPDC089569]|uniref:TIGR02444 family protein n=1 Tax=Pseudomonas sp. NPDC089569 TaxID=3390722 RepID=UPI003D038BC1
MSSDLWSFSLALYAQPGIEQACLQLQSTGSNVCLLLCAAWLGQQGISCDEQRLQQLHDTTRPWDAEVVRPLRALRMQWKTAAAQDSGLQKLREQVKTLEQEAERQLLLRLECVAKGWPRHEASDLLAWLEGMVAGSGHLDRDALHQLHVAVTGS